MTKWLIKGTEVALKEKEGQSSDVMVANVQHQASLLDLFDFCHCCIGSLNTQCPVTLWGVSREHIVHLPLRYFSRPREQPENKTFVLQQNESSSPPGSVTEASYVMQNVYCVQILSKKFNYFISANIMLPRIWFLFSRGAVNANMCLSLLPSLFHK